MDKMMKVTIADFASTEVQSKSDSDLTRAITEGKGKVKSVTKLAGEPEDVVAFMRTLKNKKMK
jgi:DNA-binding protein YbaB